jgi:hypothetical protein
VRSLVYRYFLYQGSLPPSTSESSWVDVRLEQLGLDDPPVPSEPAMQRKRVALDLQRWFEILGSGLESPFRTLGEGSSTLAGLADWCTEHQLEGI